MASSTWGRGHDSISASTWSRSVRQTNASAALPAWAAPSQTAKASQATALKPAKCFFICRNLLELRHLGDENVASMIYSSLPIHLAMTGRDLLQVAPPMAAI